MTDLMQVIRFVIDSTLAYFGTKGTSISISVNANACSTPTRRFFGMSPDGNREARTYDLDDTLGISTDVTVAVVA